MSETTTAQHTRKKKFGGARQKVPAFARFKGTSAWKKYPRRAREYAVFRAAEKLREAAVGG